MAMSNNSASLVPGANPTGLPRYGGEGFIDAVGTSSGANPLLPQPNLPASAPGSNPYNTSVVPTFGANSGGGYTPSNLLATGPSPGSTNVSTAAASPIGGMNLMSPTDIARMYKELKGTYGDGVAHSILDFLTSGAGFNQGAINNLFAALQPGIERGTESLMNQFSTSGNRFGSGAQIGMADYLSQVQLNEGQIETQMYESAINDYMNTLMGTGSAVAQTKANSGSIWDTIGGGLIDAASIIGAPFTGGASLAGLSVGNTLLSKGLGGGSKSSGPSYIPINTSGGTSSSYNPRAVNPALSGQQTTTFGGQTYDMEGNIISSAPGLSPESASIYDVTAGLTGGSVYDPYNPTGGYSGMP